MARIVLEGDTRLNITRPSPRGITPPAAAGRRKLDVILTCEFFALTSFREFTELGPSLAIFLVDRRRFPNRGNATRHVTTHVL